MRICFRRAAVLFGLSLVVSAGCFFGAGQRLLHATVEAEGKPVLSCYFGVPDRWSPADAWQELEGKSFEPAETWKPEQADTKQITLKGKVRLVLRHVDRPFAAAELEELRLVADPDQPLQWKLAPGEVARTAKQVK